MTTTHHHHHPRNFTSLNSIVAGGSLIVFMCLLATLSNPFSPVIKAEVKKRVSTQEQRHPLVSRRDGELLDAYAQGGTAAVTEALKKNGTTSVNAMMMSPNYETIDLVLPQFPTLQAALDQSDVVALYFAASWCKMSTPVTAMIDQFLGPKLKEYRNSSLFQQQPQQQPSSSLPPVKSVSANKKHHKKHKKSHQNYNNNNQRRPLSLIYVSSDASQPQFRSYNRNRFWITVPFHSSGGKPERRGLKEYFKVCTKRELEKLGITREHELPYLVVLSGTSHKIISNNGVAELTMLKDGVIDYWRGLARADNSKATQISK